MKKEKKTQKIARWRARQLCAYVYIYPFIISCKQSTRSLFISAARLARIFLGYLFSVHRGMESISRSRETLSDWKPVSTEISDLPYRSRSRVPPLPDKPREKTLAPTDANWILSSRDENARRGLRKDEASQWKENIELEGKLHVEQVPR